MDLCLGWITVANCFIPLTKLYVDVSTIYTLYVTYYVPKPVSLTP